LGKRSGIERRRCARAALMLGMLLLCPLAQAATPCFDAASSRNLPFEVYQQAPPPPRPDAPSYNFYPLSAAVSADLERLNQSQGPVRRYYFLWANRCQAPASGRGACGWNQKGNFVFQRATAGTPELRTFFSSLERADACTLAQASRLLGDDDASIDAYARAAGSSNEKGPPGAMASRAGERVVDRCPLAEQALAPDAAGIVLDYETSDGRTPAYTTAFLRRFAALVHAHHKQALLYLDPWDAPSQVHTGIDASNANAVYQLFDRVGVMLWHGNRQGGIADSAQAQLELLRRGGAVDPKRLVLVFELANTAVADARSARALVLDQGLAGVMFWRDRAAQGGSCDSEVNRKIACLVLGRCEG
jgi:hypothetical protein